MKRLTFSLLIIFLVANSIGYAALIEDFDFDSDAVGEIPDGWFVPCTPGGFLGVVDNQYFSPTNSLRAVDSENSLMTWLGRELSSPQAPLMTLEFQVMNTGAGPADFAISKGAYLGPGDPQTDLGNAIFWFEIEDGYLRYSTGGHPDEGETLASNVENDQWHKIMIEVNSFTSAKVWLDDNYVGMASNHTQSPVTEITHIHIGASGGPGNVADAYFDDVKVYGEPIPEPSTICLMGFGLLGVLGIFIRQRRKVK